MRRRKFIILLAGAVFLSLPAAHAQQKPQPVIGLLFGPTPTERELAAFYRGLSEAGYVKGQNLRIEYRVAEGYYDRLPALANDLVNRHVDLIAAMSGTPTILAAKAATSTIPIVFFGGGDLVAMGMIASLSRPGGNITGMSILAADLPPKRLELLSELVPQARLIAFLINPNNPSMARMVEDVRAAAQLRGIHVDVLRAASGEEIETAFGVAKQRGAGALLVAADPFLSSQRERLIALAANHAIPTMHEWRESVVAGGLISYAPSPPDIIRKVGNYAGRILAGAKPADLPVQQPATFELAINLKTAKALGLTVPPSILARADEVVE